MDNGSHAGLFKVEIKHRSVIAKRYTWEIHSIGQAIRVQESPGTFVSWEEASLAGEAALIAFVKTVGDKNFDRPHHEGVRAVSLHRSPGPATERD